MCLDIPWTLSEIAYNVVKLLNIAYNVFKPPKNWLRMPRKLRRDCLNIAEHFLKLQNIAYNCLQSLKTAQIAPNMAWNGQKSFEISQHWLNIP